MVEIKAEPREQQDADGEVGLEVQQQSRADDPVFPCGGKYEAQRSDHRDGDEGHVFSCLVKLKNEKRKRQAQYWGQYCVCSRRGFRKALALLAVTCAFFEWLGERIAPIGAY